MKRYRILAYDFDTRATILSREIEEAWEPQVKEIWAENKIRVREGLLAEYGPWDGFRKIDDFTEMGSAPVSVIAFHNNFFRQVRSAFVIGAYYPALTGACALGERILNQLVLQLREDLRGSPEYKKVYNRDSFDNWDLAIDTLENWQVVLPEVVVNFRKLRDAWVVTSTSTLKLITMTAVSLWKRSELSRTSSADNSLVLVHSLGIYLVPKEQPL